MRLTRLVIVLFAMAGFAILSGCFPTQTIVVRFEDLRSDMVVLEQSLYDNKWEQNERWMEFDWDNRTITIKG